MGLCSINTSMTPFCSSCDSTRLNMSVRQLGQSLTHPNCDVPYVLSRSWRDMKDTSHRGINIAQDDGEVIYNNSDIMVLFYPTGNGGKGSFQVKRTPPLKKTHSNYCSSLRHSLDEGTNFNAGDIIYEYDAFKNGYPTFGYNLFTLYTPFFGLNHEDSIVINESTAEKMKHKLIDTVYVPIFEFTLLQKLYENELEYFPDFGEKLKKDILCCSVLPTDYNKKEFDPTAIRQKVLNVLKGMNISDLLNMKSNGVSGGFILDNVKTKIENSTVQGIKIHRLRKNVPLIDTSLQKSIEKLHTFYAGKFIIPTLNDLTAKIGDKQAIKIMKQFFVYSDRDRLRGNLNLKDAVYLLEFQLAKEYETETGDKMANRYAGKGVISLILPDELCPVAVESKQKVDFIYNPFGVFSRMNLSQIHEAVTAKAVWKCDNDIKNNPNLAAEKIRELNETVIKHLGDPEYYKRVNNLADNISKNEETRNKFIDDINKGNLFIEAPAFSNIDFRSLMKNAKPNIMEPILIKKELINYMKDKLDVFKDLTVNSDILLKKSFASMIYIQKLYKIADKIVSARDLGSVKGVTGQPYLKGTKEVILYVKLS